MRWDEQLIEDCREEDGTLHPATDHVLSGARWQRDQLRTDEAVERLARHLYERDGQLWPWDDHNDHCGRPEDCKVKPAYFDTARAAIDALLGEA